MFSEQTGPEAKQWLERNRHPAALASNRFGSTEEALEFVTAVYAAGAKRVIIPQDSIRDDEGEMSEGGPYADAVVIELDPEKDTGEALRLYKAEALGEGFDLASENPVIEGRWLYLWWD